MFRLWILIVCCLFLVSLHMNLVGGNPALHIYKIIERGALEGVDWSPLFLRTTLEAVVGAPLDAYPCTQEPFFIHVHIKNARDEDHSFLPYGSFWESYNGDFFHVRDLKDESVKAKYIGPVSTHIFPPPEDVRNDLVIHMPKKQLLTETSAIYPAEYHFEYDLAKNYEFPYSGTFRAIPDSPILWLNPETNQFEMRRLWGTHKTVRVNLVEECLNARVTVNEIKDKTEFSSTCSEEQADSISAILKRVKEVAQEALNFLEEATSSATKQATLIDCFGASGANEESITRLKSVFEKVAAFTPSVVDCADNEPYLLDTTDAVDWEFMNSFEYHYYQQAEEEDEDEEEEEEPVYEIIDDQSGIKDMTYRCNPGITAWLIPRDLSSTIHVCPSLFTLDPHDAAVYILDSIVRFEKVADAVDYVYGDQKAHDLAQKYDTEISFKNAGSYSLFARKISPNSEDVLVNADV